MNCKLLFLLLNSKNSYENKNFIELLKNENKETNEDWLINYQEIKKLCEANKYNPLKLYYFNREYIHKILYDKEEIITINSNEMRELSYYFYLSLLIKDNPNVINYSYSFEFIKEIYDYINNNENNNYKK